MNFKNTLKEMFQPSNMIIILANVFVYMLIQTLFFYFIASKQFNNLLINKVDIVNDYISVDKNANNNMRQFLQTPNVTVIQEKAKSQNNECKTINIKNIIKYIGLPFIITIICLCYFIYALIKYKKEFTSADKFALFLILAVYAIDLLFFFLVIKKYEFVGDEYLYYNLYKNIKTDLMKDNILKSSFNIISSSYNSKNSNSNLFTPSATPSAPVQKSKSTSSYAKI
jgi:hypothetical protein